MKNLIPNFFYNKPNLIMKNTGYWFIVVVFLAITTYSQNFNNKLSYTPSLPHIQKNTIAKLTQDTLHILAVMVEFNPDADQTTVGDGTFNSIYTQTYTNIIDPLPHDINHFSAHLDFAKNYYKKGTKDNLAISYKILPGIITVSQTMKSYSPPINSNDFSGMASFTKEVWEAAVAQNPTFDFSQYSLFTIFHAGVGRDISLPGSLGNERDLPSIYMGLPLLQKSLGTSFDGVPAGGGFKISNSMILPQTNNREVESFGGKYLFEVTINGLLVANIASHLGLPDLFDTKTGLSAIGRFGLMDGQSIFAYNGTLPPQFSAWELLFLSNKYNWNVPVKTITVNSIVSIKTENSAFPQDTTILKIPINSTEYYLIENKQRDPEKNGITIDINNNGSVYQKVFLKDTTGFYSFSIDSLEGVVINTDNFDWAIPGSGIIIWHIDENIINENIADNQINSDKYKRGVRVIEADGINDIGEQFETIFGDILIGEGSQDDFFFASNSSDLYIKNKNKFNSETRPATLSTSGAYSLINFSDFSDTSNSMSFNISLGDSIVKPILNLKLQYSPDELLTIEKSGLTDYYYLSNNSLYKINSSGFIIDSVNMFSQYKPMIAVANSTEYLVGAYGTKLNVLSYGPSNRNYNSVDIGDSISTSPTLSKTPIEQNRILFGTKSGKYYNFTLGITPTFLSADSSHAGEGEVEYVLTNDLYSAYLINDIALMHTTGPDVATSTGCRYSDNNYSLIIPDRCKSIALTKTKDGKYVAVILGSSNQLYLVSEGKIINEIKIPGSETVNKFIISDIKNDGENYIIFSQGNNIEAINLKGARGDNFPFADPSGVGFTDALVSADIAGDKKGDIIALTKDGRIFAFDGGSAKVFQSFPLDPGKSSKDYLTLFTSDNKLSLAGIDNRGNIYGWNLSPTSGDIYWQGTLANERNDNFVPSASKSAMIMGGFLPKDRVYNYPNPVYDGSTNIRYYVTENSKITVKIFDLAGDYVAELNDDAPGGFDSETIWDVKDIQSGIYLARIEAVSETGKSESITIKIAVVK
ncbi:MAG: T9SS type A sorting domain-containing protein [Ignavibacteriaceae bacterium]